MNHATRLRTKLQLFLQVESSGFALGLAIIFVVFSLSQPFWSFGRAAGTDQSIGSFAWVTFTADEYNRGHWIGTSIVPYTEPGFLYPSIASVASSVYILSSVYLVVLGIALALFRFQFAKKMPTANLMILSLVVLGVALVSLFYPIVATPAAATTDIAQFTIPGFWGSAEPNPGVRWSWGPGLGWWLFLAGAILGIGGTVLPYVKSLRAMVPAPGATRPSS